MPPVVVFPDAVAVAVGFLNAEFEERDEAARATHTVPSPRPDTFVTVVRGGGVRTTVITESPLLLVECWAASVEAAHDLAQLCRGLLHSMAGTVVDGVPVYRVDDVGGPVDLPDPESAQHRFTFSVQLHLRGATT